MLRKYCIKEVGWPKRRRVGKSISKGDQFKKGSTKIQGVRFNFGLT